MTPRPTSAQSSINQADRATLAGAKAVAHHLVDAIARNVLAQRPGDPFFRIQARAVLAAHLLAASSARAPSSQGSRLARRRGLWPSICSTYRARPLGCHDRSVGSSAVLGPRLHLPHRGARQRASSTRWQR